MIMKPFEKARSYLVKWIENQNGGNLAGEQELLRFLYSQAKRMLKGFPYQDIQESPNEFWAQWKPPVGLNEDDLWHRFTGDYYGFLCGKRAEWKAKALQEAGLADFPAKTRTDLHRIQAMVDTIKKYFPSVTNKELLALLLNMGLEVTDKRLGEILGVTNKDTLSKLKKKIRSGVK